MGRARLWTIFLVVLTSLIITIQYRWVTLFSVSTEVRAPVALDQIMENRSNGHRNVKKMLEGALLAGNTTRAKGFLTIGIPTVNRQKGASYLLQTITSLLTNTKEGDLRDITVLVFLADLDNSSRIHVYNQILGEFKSHVESGVIKIIRASEEFYPSLEGLPRSYGHSNTKVKWRSKQNLDYAFMMLYSKDLSEYYLQLEDDVLTVPDYIQIMKGFIAEQKRNAWTCLEFSALGFIAKLYHSFDLEKLAKLLILFFYEQPNDDLYLHFNQIKLQSHRIVRKPTIFKHLGVLSSLTEKTENRQDPLFKEVGALSQNDNSFLNNTVLNPPAAIKSTFQTYNKNTADLCYSGKSIMWTLGPRRNHRLTILFREHQRIYSVKVVTGTDDHPDDFLQSGVLQIGQTVVNDMCSGIIAAQPFKMGQAFIEFDKPVQSIGIACVQVLTLKDQMNWLQVGEISVRALL